MNSLKAQKLARNRFTRRGHRKTWHARANLGIGLILFNAKNAKDPKFEIRVRAVKHEPDMFYVTRRTGSTELLPDQWAAAPTTPNS